VKHQNSHSCSPHGTKIGRFETSFFKYIFLKGMPFVAVFVLFSLLSDPNYFSFFNGLLLYCFLVGVDSDYRD